jgi:chromosomal replication initiator protein
MRSAPEKKVVYLTAERFLSSLRAGADGAQGGGLQGRAALGRSAADRRRALHRRQAIVQEELFHTLAALMEDGRRVVFSADRPPAALIEMDARLRSHLSGGPGLRHRAGRPLCGSASWSARRWCCFAASRASPRSLRAEVLQFLADRFTDSVRELEGALNTLIVRAGAGVAGLTLEEVQAILRPHLRGGEKRVTVDDIQKATADYFGLKQADLISERRTRAVARPARRPCGWPSS